MSSFGPSDPRTQKRKAQKTVGIVMGVAALVLLLPAGWFAGLDCVLQSLMAPASRLTLLSAEAVSGQRSSDEDGLTADGELSDTQTNRLLTVLSLRISQLERENQNLQALRTAIEPQYALLPAQVVGHDSLGLASIAIDKGAGVTLNDLAAGGVRPESPVIVAIPSKLTALRNVNPQIVLGCGAFLGTIAPKPGPYVSRVNLVTGFREPFACHVLRLDPNAQQIEIIVSPMSVMGNGKDRLVSDPAVPVPTEKAVEVGDLVVLAKPEAFGLPINMAVGTVEKVRQRTDSPLHADLVIEPFFSRSALDKVYVLIQSGLANP